MSEIVERAARKLYEGSPLYESGEAIDGFQVTPGGDISWDHALSLAAEFGGEYQAVLDEHRAMARAVLMAALHEGDEFMEHSLAKGMSRPPREGDLWDDGDPYSVPLAKKALASLRALVATLPTPQEAKEGKGHE